MDAVAADRHDTWNMITLGALNVAQSFWWFNLCPKAISGSSLVAALFAADMSYLALDFGWLVFLPGCVPPATWPTLILHHGVILCCGYAAWGQPVLMSHLLRTWIVEVHSFVHIAARKLGSKMPLLQRINKPLFVVLRLVIFPLTWFAYARDRSALPPAVQAAQLPMRLHLPLSLAHLAIYGLMCKWGHGLILKRSGNDDVPKPKAS